MLGFPPTARNIPVFDRNVNAEDKIIFSLEMLGLTHLSLRAESDGAWSSEGDPTLEDNLVYRAKKIAATTGSLRRSQSLLAMTDN